MDSNLEQESTILTKDLGNYFITVNTPTKPKYLEIFPNDPTILLAYFTSYYLIDFYTINTPIRESYLRDKCLNDGLLGYCTTIITKNNKKSLYFATIGNFKIERSDLKIKKLETPLDIYCQYIYPLKLQLNLVVSKCNTCNENSFIMSSCLNEECPIEKIIKFDDLHFIQTNIINNTENFFVIKRSGCKKCDNCKICRRNNKKCKRHLICLHSKKAILSAVR